MSVEPGSLVLIVEDEFLIAMSYVEEVQLAGLIVAGPFPSCALALEWLKQHSPDMAILNVLLADRDCRPIVEILRSREIPWLLISGLPREGISPSFVNGRWLSKPCSWFHLQQHLTEMRIRQLP